MGGPVVDGAGAWAWSRRCDRIDGRGKDPSAAAERWAAVLGISATADGSTAVVELSSSGQRLRFVSARAGHGEGITTMSIAGLPGGGPLEIGGVSFVSEGG